MMNVRVTGVDNLIRSQDVHQNLLARRTSLLANSADSRESKCLPGWVPPKDMIRNKHERAKEVAAP